MKVMDIIKNWNKGKKAHDERVTFKEKIDMAQKQLADAANRVFSQHQNDEMASLSIRLGKDTRPERIQDVERIFGYIEDEACKDAPSESFEAKLWQILAEYAADQVKALTEPKRETVETCAPYSKVDPSIREKIETFPSKFAKGGYVGDMPNAIV